MVKKNLGLAAVVHLIHFGHKAIGVLFISLNGDCCGTFPRGFLSAVETLFDIMEARRQSLPEPAPRQLLIPPTLVIRDSC